MYILFFLVFYLWRSIRFKFLLMSFFAMNLILDESMYFYYQDYFTKIYIAHKQSDYIN